MPIVDECMSTSVCVVEGKTLKQATRSRQKPNKMRILTGIVANALVSIARMLCSGDIVDEFLYATGSNNESRFDIFELIS